jgi:predicted Zn-dependent protease with MMP-like domain
MQAEEKSELPIINNRHITIVAFQVFEKIPESEKAFKENMKNFIYNDMPYRSPEVLNDLSMWNKFELLMHRYITSGDEPWKQECIDIYTGKT